MADYYERVLQYAICGNGVLLVGSGASTEMGYPSWFKQLELIRGAIKDMDRDKAEAFDRAVSDRKYQVAMEIAENEMGREWLLNTLSRTLKPSNVNNDAIYCMLTKWPFSLFLTTNFDNELVQHLTDLGRTDFIELGNSEKDFVALTEDAHDYVFKIHGQLTVDGGAVVTDKDYDELITKKSRAYYREALERIFKTRPIVVVGYSLQDPDIRYLLTKVTEQGSVARPICMFLANVSEYEKNKYERLFRVQIIDYHDTDGRHSELKRILGTLDPFICPNTSTAIHTENSRNAAALYLFKCLRRKRTLNDVERHILISLSSSTEECLKSNAISKILALEESLCENVLKSLKSEGLAQGDAAKGYRRTNAGDCIIEDCRNKFEVIKNASMDGLIQDFGMALPDAESGEYKKLADQAISAVFDKRGMTLAENLYGNHSVSTGELVDIYSAIAPIAAAIKDGEKRLLFINAIRRFVLRPTAHQKEYLVALSQGYFLYHLMGNERIVKDTGSSIISNSMWVIDSHILLALIAEGCSSHKFTKDLFETLHSNKAKLLVTPGVVEEVMYHFAKAEEALANVGQKDLHKLATSLCRKRDYNFFIDGYIQSQATGIVGTLARYRRKIARNLVSNMSNLLDTYNIHLQCCAENEFATKLRDKMIPVVEKIRRVKNKEIEPSSLKVKTDVELYIVIKQLEAQLGKNSSNRVYFLSHSTVFDRVEDSLHRWTDYALYSFLKSLPDERLASDSMYECLHSELVSSGLSIVDSQNYSRFFAEETNMARLDFDEEKDAYLKDVESDTGLTRELLEQRFNEVPDLEKPRFVEALQISINQKLQPILDQERRSRMETMRKLDEQKAENDRLKELLAEAEKEIDKANRRNAVVLSTMRNSKNPSHIAKKRRQEKKKKRRNKHK